MTNWRTGWQKFAAAVEGRLADGERAYGDRSFTRPPDQLAVEVEQEILDLAAWSFILWVRLQIIKPSLGDAEHENASRPTGI